MSRLLSCWGRGRTQPAAAIQPLHKPFSALTHAPICTHKALESLQDVFWQCPHSSAGFSIAHLKLIFTWVFSCPYYWTMTLPHGSSHDDCLWEVEADEGSSEKKIEGKAFSFIYFSKICNHQMHLLSPEVIILFPLLHDLAIALGGGSNLFQVLLFEISLSL